MINKIKKKKSNCKAVPTATMKIKTMILSLPQENQCDISLQLIPTSLNPLSLIFILIASIKRRL